MVDGVSVVAAVLVDDGGAGVAMVVVAGRPCFWRLIEKSSESCEVDSASSCETSSDSVPGTKRK